MTNPYIQAMEKQAGLVSKTRTVVADLLNRANLGVLNTPVRQIRIRSPIHIQGPAPTPAASAASAALTPPAPNTAPVAAPANTGPGFIGSTWNAAVRTTKGAASAPVDYTKALIGSNVNATIMHHARVLGKFTDDAGQHAFEKQLKGMSDEAKLKFTQDNLGAPAVKEVQRAMNTRAVTRTATGVAAGAAVAGRLSQDQDNQY